MSAKSTLNLAMPEANWETIKKIVRAYHALKEREDCTVEAVASAAGLQRPRVSANNGFLRAIGVLEADKNKLTANGSQLATGIGLRNKALVEESLRRAVSQSSALQSLVETVQAREEMRIEDFKAQAIMAIGLDDTSRFVPFLQTILDMLEEAGLLSTLDDLVRPGSHYIKNVSASMAQTDAGVSRAAPDLAPQRTQDIHSGGIPLPLGPNRLAFLQLPENWEAKDLPKLLKIIELALGEDRGQTG